MNALERLQATHEPLRELGTAWRERHELDLSRLEELHVEATLAAHEHYCRHLPAYRTLATDLDLVDCRDVALIRSELASTDDLFKSYDEAWIDVGDFGAMTRWIGSIYAGPVQVDLAGVTTIQGWLEALESTGTRVWFSSGTSGHLSFVPRDELAARNLDTQIGTLVGPLLGGVESGARYDAVLLSFQGGRQGLASAADKLASVTGRQTYLYEFAVTPDGVRAAARGDEAAASEFRRRTVDELPQRYAVVLDALRRSVADARPALLVGAPFQVADICELLARASECVTLPPGSLLFLAGGWKSFEGSKISREELIATVTERLGITRVMESYGMTECTTQLPLCGSGRFHVPPTLWPMVFDDALTPIDGLGRGRFGFSDPFATSIPGLFISGDEIDLTLEGCACGLPGYSFVGEVRRAAGREVKGCGGVMSSVRG
ncbi:MAG: hypothetical protein QOH27_5274 [Mycobacterium sp.]|nr:hypothetical protein [Mycobacterium sp.]